MPGVPSLTAFTGQTPPWSLTSLDANFANLSALLKDVGNYNPYVVDGGAADAYVVTFGAGITYTLASKPMVVMKASNTNTGASTLNAQATGVKNILNVNGSALGAGQITSGGVYILVYDGTQYILIGGTSTTTNSTTTFTLTGCTTAPTYVGKWTLVGNVVALSFPGTSIVSATSNTTAKTLTGMPAAIRPSGDIYAAYRARDNSGPLAAAMLIIASTGVITLEPDMAGSAWTAGGTAGVWLPTMSWTIA